MHKCAKEPFEALGGRLPAELGGAALAAGRQVPGVFEGASEAIAMAEVDRQGILGLQILFADAGKNFAFESVQAVAGGAGDPDRIAIFPVVMLPKVVLVQYYDLIPIGGALRDMGRAWRISINNMQAQISLLERPFGACDSFLFNVRR